MKHSSLRCISVFVSRIKHHVQEEGGGGGGVATLLWHIVCAAPKVYSFLRRFVLKTGIDSAHFGLEFEETRGVFNRVLIPNE